MQKPVKLRGPNPAGRWGVIHITSLLRWWQMAVRAGHEGTEAPTGLGLTFWVLHMASASQSGPGSPPITAALGAGPGWATHRMPLHPVSSQRDQGYSQIPPAVMTRLHCARIKPVSGCYYSHFLNFFFFNHASGTWKFPGQSTNLRLGSNLSHSSDNTGPLTHCATRELLFACF